jgi:acyl carrier protein
MSASVTDREEVYKKVKECIIDAVGVDDSDIKPDSQIVNDLGADSLDLVALLYQLETSFNVSLQRGAIINKIKQRLPEGNFLDSEGYISPKGKEMIREELPELATCQFMENMPFEAILTYFTVDVFVNLILRALKEQNTDEVVK